MKTALVATLATALVAAGLTGAAGAAVAAPATGPTRAVIVLLRDQHPDLPATTGGVGRRAQAVAADQARVADQVAGVGGRTTHRYTVLNAVAASVPAGAVGRLQHDPAVAAVVPDLPVAAPARPTAETGGGAAAARPVPSGICPTSADQPLLEPEALGLTRTAADDPAVPTARSLGYDGSGVTVGFIADGVDTEVPDFIRPDGSHVFTDYQDFSGDGTASPTSGAEGMGDAGSIAAQGRQVYDLQSFVARPRTLPAGCTIRVEGTAPGASLVGLKVFPNALPTAPTSVIVQAVDYAVTVDHVDVLNESFGSNPYPDDATDPISLANRAAVDAGIPVVASTGDAGAGNTMGTAATDPWVIGVGASTQFRSYAQTGDGAFPLGNGRWASDQPSSISSSGISQTDRVMDLLAPGDLGWSTCSARTAADGSPLYTGCADNAGRPSDLQLFGGTSEAAPLVAGIAALVVQAYRKTHGGADPTPDQVRRVLDSTADDLGLPAEDQGAGRVDAYRAVQAAAALDHPRAASNGPNLVLGQTSLGSVTTPGAPLSQAVTVTNVGSGTQQVSAATRQVDSVTADLQRTVGLDATSARTFVDAFGFTRAYVKTTFTVAPGTDRLVASAAIPTPGKLVRLSLFDPAGTFTGYSIPQGTAGFGSVAVTRPATGTWTAVLWTRAGTVGYSGDVAFRATAYRATTAGAVSPASFTLAPGASQQLTVTGTAPARGAVASSVVLTADLGLTTTLPVVTEVVQPVTTASPASFSGQFDEANGRAFGPGDTETYRFAVPAGARDLDVRVSTQGGPNASGVVAHLSDPSGEPVATVGDQHQEGTTTVTDPGLQLQHAAPAAGVWQLTLELLNPVTGRTLPRTYRGVVSLDTAPVSSTGVPTGGATVSRASGAKASITVTNTGPAPQTFFVDPRTTTTTTYPLVAVVAGTGRDPYTASVPVPLTSTDVPTWIVPTQSSRLVVGSSATRPTVFDVMPLDNPTAINAPSNPDVYATVAGNAATATHTASPVASSQWAAFPAVVGPVGTDPAAAQPVTMQASVDTLTFADDVRSSTGDPLLATVRSHPPAATPVTVAPGRSVTITVRFQPTAAVGTTVSGTVFLDTLFPGGAQGVASYADTTAAFAYSYTVGA